MASRPACAGLRSQQVERVEEALQRHVDRSRRQARCTEVGQGTVATLGVELAEFVVVHQDEVEQVYVAAVARGTGVAAALLARAEQMVPERYDTA